VAKDSQDLTDGEFPKLQLGKEHQLAKPWSPRSITFVEKAVAADGIAAVESGEIGFYPLEGVYHEPQADTTLFKSKAFDKVWVLTCGKNQNTFSDTSVRACSASRIDREAYRNAGGSENRTDTPAADGVVAPPPNGHLPSNPLPAAEAACATPDLTVELLYIDGFVRESELETL